MPIVTDAAPLPPRRPFAPKPTHVNEAIRIRAQTATDRKVREGPPEIELEPSALLTSEAALFWKRVVDLVVTLLLAPLVLAIGAVVALAIKLDSSGPVFFTQSRLGQGGRRFPLLKFRTMVTDADEMLESLLEENPELRREYEEYHKLESDPRVTPLGRWLRRLSLDELPQLWHVLTGEMSLVGPRAYTPDEIEEMNGAHDMILRVKPGLTGFWQAGGRNGMSFGERLSMDLMYVSNWSIAWDFFLLVCTARIVLGGREAY